MSTEVDAVTSGGMADAIARVAAIRSSLASLTGAGSTTAIGSTDTSTGTFEAALSRAVSSFPTPGASAAASVQPAAYANPSTSSAAGASPVAAVTPTSGTSGATATDTTGRAGLGRGAWVLPVHGVVTSPFGMRTHPVTGVRKLHTGTDFAATAGTQVGAAAAGKVISAGWEAGNGNTVVIDHGSGISTKYAHASKLLVDPGDRVSAGQAVIEVGSTGLATGPHLHLEVRENGQPVDAVPWLRARGVDV
jgi:murein DD-endopeptidase MepM/ murein hydrolase activator NlpD